MNSRTLLKKFYRGPMTNLQTAKFNMIEQQIRPWEVINPNVLEVINDLNRHEFVPEQYQNLAYADCHIPFSSSQSMMKPVLEGRLLQALNIKDSDTCLEVGTGTGYLTACLASLARTVHTIEIDDDSLQQAKQKLSAYSNISFEHANALNSVNSDGQYDVIAVTSSALDIPANFKQALTIGGRLFIVAGQSPTMQALLITRLGTNEWAVDSLFETELNSLLS